MTKPTSGRRTRSNKFPLTLHKTGQYCKKIRGKIHYFGTDRRQAPGSCPVLSWQLRTDNQRLSDQIARLKRNLSNSSKPPSSDIVKPKKKGTSWG